MSVELDPPELGFKRPFQHEVSQILRLHNPHSDPVAFKVKTTAPKQYCVRPNSGRIEPGSHVEVQILLQAMKEDPPADAKCRDKFLVQSVLIAPDKEFTNTAALWAHIEQTNKQAIQEKKIRVVFLPADDVAHATPKTNGAAHREDHTATSSPSQEAFTPQQGTTTTPASHSTPASRPVEKAKESVPAASQVKATVGAAASGIANAIPTSGEDVQAQLADAKATIAKLTKQAQESSGLRQRRAEPTHESQGQLATAERVQQTPAGGVPVQVVFGLCLASFLLAYFLF